MDAYEKSQAALFERLLQPHMPRMYRFACRLTHSQPEAEDLFQDVLTKVFGRLEELAELRDPGPWLNRVLYNHFIDKQRRYARQRLHTVTEGQLPGQSLDALPAAGDASGDGQRLEAIGALQAALESLSDEHRTVVLLHDAEGYKLEEIHKITGEPLGTIKSRLHRARARLREILRDHGTF
jgi:RNA polymerase sigma-70 factor (ECF subfamily)